MVRWLESVNPFPEIVKAQKFRENLLTRCVADSSFLSTVNVTAPCKIFFSKLISSCRNTSTTFTSSR